MWKKKDDFQARCPVLAMANEPTTSRGKEEREEKKASANDLMSQFADLETEWKEQKAVGLVFISSNFIPNVAQTAKPDSGKGKRERSRSRSRDRNRDRDRDKRRRSRSRSRDRDSRRRNRSRLVSGGFIFIIFSSEFT